MITPAPSTTAAHGRIFIAAEGPVSGRFLDGANVVVDEPGVELFGAVVVGAEVPGADVAGSVDVDAMDVLGGGDVDVTVVATVVGAVELVLDVDGVVVVVVEDVEAG